MTTYADDLRALIGQVVDLEICGRTLDGVVQDVREVRDSMGWREELVVARNGSTFQVPLRLADI